MAEKLGIDMVWFLVLIGMNMQTSFLTPPFGFALFYLRSVAPVADYDDAVSGKRIAGIKTTMIYRGVIPFIVIQLIALAVIFIFPELVSAELEPRRRSIWIRSRSMWTATIPAVAAGTGGLWRRHAGIRLAGACHSGAEDSPPAAPQEESAAPAEPDPNQMLMDALKEGAKKK